MSEPTLSEIKNGWAALKNGRAVHGKTPEEALWLFHESEERGRIILAREDASVVAKSLSTEDNDKRRD